MPTFLTNANMNPALRARIVRSLSGRSRSSRLPPRFVAALRLVSVLGIALAIGTYVSHRREQAETLRRTKQDLIERIERHATGISEEDRKTVPRAREWLERLGAAYAGDRVGPELGTPEAVAREFRRPAAYVRADSAELSSPASIASAIAESTPESLVRCLYDPPEARDEKALLERLRDSGAVREGSALLVEPLGAAEVALPLLDPAFAEQVERADHVAQVRELARVVEGAPLLEARRAARAEVLVVALDEPKPSGVVVELDGTHRHAVRIHVVDLRAERELGRVRLEADPEWVSESKRVKHARALVDCRLGFDARRALAGQSALP